MTELTLFGSADALQQTTQGLASLSAETSSGGMNYMKLEKGSGNTIWGAEENIVDPDDLWIVNPVSFMRGYIGWLDGKVAGEEMHPVASGKIVDVAALPHIEKQRDGDGWREQMTFNVKHLKEGYECEFKTSAAGGREAIGKLGTAIGRHLAEDSSTPLAVITFGADSYQHKKFGKTWFPVFTVVGFRDSNAEPAQARKLV